MIRIIDIQNHLRQLFIMEFTFDKPFIEKIPGNRFSQGNNVRLLYKGKDSFGAIFESIESARDFICLEFYIFRNDETGTEIADLLKKKSSEGVRIYLLYDHFGSFGTPTSFWDNLKSAGINIMASRPFKWSSPFHYIRRDHRKLIIIDGKKAFTGGLNMANEYRGFHIKMKKVGWRDTGIMLEGPIALELFDTFHRAWKTWGGKDINFVEGRVSGSKGQEAEEKENNGLPVIPIFAASSKGRRRMRKLLYYSINNAGKNILLTTAYFTPSRMMIDSLENAVKRGVEVKLLLPGESDVLAAHYAGRAFFTRLLRSGIMIYNYQGDVLHAKSYVFDGCWSIVGSANLDFQSLRWNDEGNVGIFDEGFGRKMMGMFEEDLKHSIEIKEDSWIKRPLCERIRERFFVLFRRRL